MRTIHRSAERGDVVRTIHRSAERGDVVRTIHRSANRKASSAHDSLLTGKLVSAHNQFLVVTPLAKLLKSAALLETR